MPLFGTSDATGLVLRIRSDSSDAKKDLTTVRTGVKELVDTVGQAMPGATGQMGAFGGALSSLLGPLSGLAGPAGLATGAILGLASAGAAAGVALYGAAKAAAAYGDEIHDASQKTGVGTDALQAFKYAAEQSGSELGNIEASLTKFTVLMGKAAQGNEEARRTLEKYKITATDVDGALAQAIQRISEMKTVSEQNAAAQELFKDRGGNVINMIREMHGDLPGLIKELKEAGIIMGEEDVEAAGELADMMDKLNKQLDGVWRTVGSKVIPIFLQLFTSLGEWLTKNQDTVKQWAEVFKDALMGAVISVRFLYNWYGGLIDTIVTGTQVLTAFAQAGTNSAAAIQALWDAFSSRQAERAKIIADIIAGRGGLSDITNTPASGALVGPGFRASDEDEKTAAEKRRKEREEAAKRDAAAAVEIIKGQLKEQDEAFAQYYEKLAERVKSGEITRSQAMLAGELYKKTKAQEIKAILDDLDAAENRQDVEDKKRESERTVTKQGQLARQRELQDKHNKILEKANKDILDAEKDRSKESVEVARKSADEKIEALDRASKTVMARREADLALGKIDEEDFIMYREALEKTFLNQKLRILEQEKKAVKGNAEETNRVNKEIAETREQIEQSGIKGEVERFEMYKRNARELLELYREVEDAVDAIAGERAAETRRQLEKSLGKEGNLEDRRKILREIAVLDIAEENRQREARDKQAKRDHDDALERVKGKANEEEQKFQIDKLYKERLLLSEEEFQRRLRKIKEDLGDVEDPFAQLKESWESFRDSLSNAASIKDSLASIGGMFLGLMQNMEQALASGIANWILYGDSVDIALRKALAAELANIAGQAGVQALRAAAWGFFMLATGNFAAAGNAFISAAMWGALAVGAGAAASAINPKQQSASSSAGAANTSPTAGQGGGQGGQVYSGYGDKVKVYEGGVPEPGERDNLNLNVGMKIKLTMEKDSVIKVVEQDVKTNGKLRNLIVDTAADA